MNLTQWDDGRRRKEPKPQHLKSILKKVSKPDDGWCRRSQCPGPAGDEPSTVHMGLGPVADRVLETERVDVELARKRKELEKIEERIMHKKVAIALKQARPLVESVSSGLPAGSDQSSSWSLRDRVHRILLQRHPAGFLSQGRSLKDRRNSAGPSVNGLPQEQHPLQLRVKELMKQRCRRPCLAERAVTDINPGPVAQPPADKSCVDIGFQRFLTVLNKGVDLDLLTKIVNDGCGVVPPGENVLNHESPAAVAEPYKPPSIESKQSNSRDDSQTGSGSHSFGSSSRSRSPPAVREKQEKAKVTEQHEQLQNILKTLGLNLEVDEMSRLASRTQERLYGRKHNNTNSDHQEEPPRQLRTHRDSSSHSSSSSSSSSSSFSDSCSTRSTSRSLSPPRCRLARDKDSLQRRTSERSGGTEELKKHGDQNSNAFETSGQPRQQNAVYFHPGPLAAAFPNHSFPHYSQAKTEDQNANAFNTNGQPCQDHQAYLHPGPLAGFPNHSLPQYGQSNTHPGGFHTQARGPYWLPPRGAHPPPSYYPNEQLYQQNPYPPFHTPAVQPPRYYPPKTAIIKDINLFVNPDLAESEGQGRGTSNPRCLQVINTQQTISECLKQVSICSQVSQGKEGEKGSQGENGEKGNQVSQGKKGEKGSQASQSNQASKTGHGRRMRRKRWKLRQQEKKAVAAAQTRAKSKADLIAEAQLQAKSQAGAKAAMQTRAKSRAEAIAAAQGQAAAAAAAALAAKAQQEGNVSESVPPDKEVKQPQTEEDIKANLKEKLEAFNKKVKEQPPLQAKSYTILTPLELTD